MSQASEAILKAAGAGLVGLVVGWAGNAVSLGGRVEAIEKTLQRIEAHLYVPPAMATKPAP